MLSHTIFTDHPSGTIYHGPCTIAHGPYMEFVLLSMVHVPSNHVLSKILTPLLVLFLICLYISHRALSKVFEHLGISSRNINGKSIIFAKAASLVTMEASLQY